MYQNPQGTMAWGGSPSHAVQGQAHMQGPGTPGLHASIPRQGPKDRPVTSNIC